MITTNNQYTPLIIFETSKQSHNGTTIIKVENLLMTQTMKEPKIAFTFIMKTDPNIKGTYSKFYLDVDTARILAQKIITNPTNGFQYTITKGNVRTDETIEARNLSIEVQSKLINNKETIQTILRTEKSPGEIIDYIITNQGEKIASIFKPKFGSLPTFSAAVILTLDETISLATAIRDEILAWRFYVIQQNANK